MSALDSKPLPGFDPDLPHPVTRQVRQSARLEGTAGDIMLAARELYETEGVAATSMAAIARKAGVARSLLYYYFPDKQAVTDAVFEDYLEDLVESVSTWNELRAFGETPSELKNCVSMLRRALYTASGDPRPMFSRARGASACASLPHSRPSARWWHASRTTSCPSTWHTGPSRSS